MESTAIYVNNDSQVVAQDLTVPPPRDGEILIQVLYSGINPADIRTSKFFGCRHRVLGNEFCGRVLESPSLVDTPFKAGDIVASYSYITIPPTGVWKVPSNVPLPDAATLTLVVQTANDAIFNRLKLPLPDAEKGVVEGTLVIWGGATSVGRAAIQLGRASGITSIVVTASKERHEYLKTLGATHCIDYRDDDVVQKVKAVLREAGQSPILGLDAIGTPNSQTLLANSTADHQEVRLTTVLLVPNEGFEVTLYVRHADVTFTLPNGELLVFPTHPTEAERMWKALAWVIEHYGGDFKAHPVRVLDTTAEETLHEVLEAGEMKTFGRVAMKHPLKR
ncbi:chaperonin 10-like protein [Ilyonectria destructans]|nr:chaperonin 10-like protein [Ilyonectria destructans]